MRIGRARHRGPASRREALVLFVAAAIFAAGFVLLTSAVWRTNTPVALDRSAERLGIREGKNGPLGGYTQWARVAAGIGSAGSVAAATAVVVGLAMIWRDLVAGVVVVLAPVLTFAVTEYVAKPAINAPIAFGGRSYPSGHGAGVAAVSVGALILVYRRWGGFGALLLVPFVGAAFAAVGLGVLSLGFHHYITDPLGGVALGATIALSLGAVGSFVESGISGMMTPRP